MGNIPSVSLPSIITCIKCDCNNKCYAHKLENFRKSVRESYENNLKILIEDKNQYWKEVSDAVKLSRYFRFHVSGDIPDKDYFEKMVEVSIKNPHTEILCFTKKFDIVNEYIRELCYKGQSIPDNLHIVFSGWVGLKMDNPFHLPEAHVRYKDGTTTAKPYAKECQGNCTECARIDDGCWTLHRGDQVVFDEH